MADYNRVIMIGNLTRDPELKTLPSGQPLCRLGIASNRQFKNRQTGAMVQEVCFIDVDVWGNQAESCRQYLQKGRAVLIEGRLKFDTWQDANGGGTRSKHTIVAERVVFLSSGASASASDELGGDSDDDSGPREPGSQLERELLEQIGQIKKRASSAQASGDMNSDAGHARGGKAEKKVVAAKRVHSRATEDHDLDSDFGGSASGRGPKADGDFGGEGKFNDEPPFADDLPF